MMMTIAREWMLTYLCNALWQIPLLWLAAALSARVVRRTGPQAEHRVWVLALVGAAVVPACSLPAMFAGTKHGAFARVTAKP